MPELVPLTATPPPQLDFSRPGTPASTAFDDIYFSVDGGLAECRDVYLRGCGLPERWQGRDHFTIAELGFGTGLNFLAALEMWAKHRPSQTARLNFISVEGFPLSQAQLERAYQDWDDMPRGVRELIAAWPDRVKGVHTIYFDNGIRLTLLHDPVGEALERLDFAADAWFLDGFSPAKNLDMWSPKILKRVHDLSAPGCRVGTFTVAGDVRRGLSAAGFDVSKQPGFGRKRERLEAVKTGELLPPMRAPNVAIIGAGIAGASVAAGLIRQGADVTIIAPDDETLASGNARAIVKPRLDVLDRPESRFFHSAYLYALQAYEGDCVTHRGIFHIAQTPKEQTRFIKVAANEALPVSHVQFQEAVQCGLNAPLGALYYPRAIVINPQIYIQDALKSAQRIYARVQNIDAEAEGVTLRTDDGSVRRYDYIVVCAGRGVRDLLPNIDVRLQRGQITKVKRATNLPNPVTYGGYAIPDDDGIWLGATHSEYEAGESLAATQVENIENTEKFLSHGGAVSEVFDARASIRVTTAITLPILSAPSERVYCMSGLGGRGFVFAPLLGEQIAMQIYARPGVIAKDALPRFF